MYYRKVYCSLTLVFTLLLFCTYWYALQCSVLYYHITYNGSLTRNMMGPTHSQYWFCMLFSFYLTKQMQRFTQWILLKLETIECLVLIVNIWLWYLTSFNNYFVHFSIKGAHIYYHSVVSSHHTICLQAWLHTILYTLHYTLYTINYKLYTIHYTLYTIHYTLYTIYHTLNTIHYTLCTMRYTLHILTTIHYTLYTLLAT